MGVGLLVAGKLIIGELRKEHQDSYIKVYVPESNRKKAKAFDDPIVHNEIGLVETKSIANEMPGSPDSRFGKVESLIYQKNVEIERLKSLLEVEQKHKLEYEKIKNLLQWQVFESRQMNREVQRELKALQVQEELRAAQEHKLRSELIYKDQLLLKKDYQLADLNMALQAHNLTNTSEVPSEKINSSNAAPSLDQYEDWRNKN